MKNHDAKLRYCIMIPGDRPKTFARFFNPAHSIELGCLARRKMLGLDFCATM
jgi:hypothetical protein